MQYDVITWRNHDLDGLDEGFEKNQITLHCCFYYFILFFYFFF